KNPSGRTPSDGAGANRASGNEANLAGKNPAAESSSRREISPVRSEGATWADASRTVLVAAFRGVQRDHDRKAPEAVPPWSQEPARGNDAPAPADRADVRL